MAKIGVDIDEVLSETVSEFLEFYNSKHHTHHEFKDISDYSFGEQFSLSPEEEVQSIKEFFASDHFANLNTVTGSEDAITELSKNHQLFAISSRPDQLLDATRTWLKLHFQDRFNEVILTNSHFDASRTKSAICNAKGLDIFIEDQTRFAEDCSDVCSKVYLLDKPWNQNKLNSKKIIRVGTWADILEGIDTYPLPHS